MECPKKTVGPVVESSTDLDAFRIDIQLDPIGMFGPAMILGCLGKGFREKVGQLSIFFLVGPTCSLSQLGSERSTKSGQQKCQL